MAQDIIKNIPLSLDINAKKRLNGTIDIQLYSKDVTTGQFEFSFIDEDGDRVVLNETYSAQALVRFKDSTETYLDDMVIEGSIIRFIFPHNFITRDGIVTMYIYITKDNYTSDVAAISFPVFLSEIDKELDPSVAVHYIGKIEQLIEDMKGEIASYQVDVDEIIEGYEESISRLQALEADYEPQLVSLTTQLAEKANQNDLETEKMRINNLVSLPEGSTTGDAELTDVRVGEGTVYNSAGDHVRAIGKSVETTFKNLLKNGNFTKGAEGWYSQFCTPVYVDGVVSFTAAARYGRVQNIGVETLNGHKYYMAGDIEANSTLVGLRIGNVQGVMRTQASGWERVSGVIEWQYADNTTFPFQVTDTRTSGWDEVKATKLILINLTKIFGVGKEPSKEDMDELVESYDGSWLSEKSEVGKLSTSLLMNILSNKKNDSPLYAKVSTNEVLINFKYSDKTDMRIELRKKGSNNIFEFNKFFLINNTLNAVSDDTVGGVLLLNADTDWFGPHRVKVTTNIDGDLPNSNHVTGGNHAYDGGIGGTATGRTTAIEVKVDGRQTLDFEGYCNFIDVSWNNKIQATNTKKADGTGREALSENIHLHFDGYDVDVDYNVETLEPLVYELIYGMQAPITPWKGEVFYHNSDNNKWLDANVSTNSNDKTCNRITLRKGSHRLDLFVDSTMGIGKRDKLEMFNAAETTTSSKTYLRLLSGSFPTEAGEVQTYKGRYRFYSQTI